MGFVKLQKFKSNLDSGNFAHVIKAWNYNLTTLQAYYSGFEVEEKKVNLMELNDLVNKVLKIPQCQKIAKDVFALNVSFHNWYVGEESDLGELTLTFALQNFTNLLSWYDPLFQRMITKLVNNFSELRTYLRGEEIRELGKYNLFILSLNIKQVEAIFFQCLKNKYLEVAYILWKNNVMLYAQAIITGKGKLDYIFTKLENYLNSSYDNFVDSITAELVGFQQKRSLVNDYTNNNNNKDLNVTSLPSYPEYVTNVQQNHLPINFYHSSNNLSEDAALDELYQDLFEDSPLRPLNTPVVNVPTTLLQPSSNISLAENSNALFCNDPACTLSHVPEQLPNTTNQSPMTQFGYQYGPMRTTQPTSDRSHPYYDTNSNSNISDPAHRNNFTRKPY